MDAPVNDRCWCGIAARGKINADDSNNIINLISSHLVSAPMRHTGALITPGTDDDSLFSGVLFPTPTGHCAMICRQAASGIETIITCCLSAVRHQARFGEGVIKCVNFLCEALTGCGAALLFLRSRVAMGLNGAWCEDVCRNGFVINFLPLH